MQPLKKILPLSFKDEGIRFEILRGYLFCAFLCVVFIIFELFILSLLVYLSDNAVIVEEALKVELFSSSFYAMMGVILLTGIPAAVMAVILTAVPAGRKLKSKLNQIRDANEKLSKGKLQTRLEISAPVEINEISGQFNILAQQMSTRVESLQRLIQVNKQLTQGAEEMASVEERRKIARELHDSISQQLFAINTMTAAILVQMDDHPVEAKKYLKVVEETAQNAQQELRALILRLRPVNLEEDCLRDGIEKLLNELKTKDDIVIYKELQDIPGVPHGVENNIFRVTQEAISNILRHSKASSFSVKLFEKKKVLHLIIEDNGIGIRSEDSKKTSYGLVSMKERIEELGGRFDMISVPDHGTRIDVRVPIGLHSIFH